ncbi:MAG TPA: flagellar export chaperone FliS [Candidatus Sulfotelmatobacter sp.]|nr:flagellar export chaperone FliS [Candidatus Sulfotelmatobacter sp.]
MNATLSYRESAVEGASPVRLVALLYEQAIEDLKRARAAIDRGDIEARTRAINHAVVVIGYLQSSLDKEQGGRVAENLERFYNQIRASLVEAQCKQSAAILERQISYLVEVHAAWGEVERANAAPAKSTSPAQSGPGQSPSEPEHRASAEWSA